MAKKFYTADEIQADIGKHEDMADAILFPDDVKNTLLFVDLYSNVCERCSNNETVDDLRTKIYDFMLSYAFPVCDFTGHENKPLVVIEESGLKDIKLDNTYRTRARVLFSLDNSLDKLMDNNDSIIFNELNKFPQAQAVCVVDFNLKIIHRIARSKN